MQKAQNLRYGQLVRIHGNYNQTHQQRGVITSKGFTDVNIYYQCYTQFSMISNYRQTLFELLPKSSFDIHDQMEKLPSNKRKSLESRAKTEKQQFQTNIKNRLGEWIYFGDQVIFRHLDSQAYVHGSFQCAKSGIGAFRLLLSKSLSSQMIFKLKPYRTYERQGDEVCRSDPIKIYHLMTHCYLSYDDTKQIFLDKLFPSLHQGRRGRPVIKQKPGRIRYQIINQNTAKRTWKIQIHQEYSQERPKSFITSHELVYLIHTKDNIFLYPNLQSQNIYLKKNSPLYPNANQDYYYGIWQIQPLSKLTDSKRENKLDHSRTQEQQNLVSLRHLLSGRVLVYKQKKACAQIKDPNSSNKLITIAIPEGGLHSHNLVDLSCQQLKLDILKKRKKMSKQRAVKKKKNQQDEDQIRRRDIQAKLQEPLEMNSDIRQHGFRIYKVNVEVKQMVLTILSAQQLIFKFCQLVRVPDQEFVGGLLQYDLLNNIAITLKMLIGFIYDCDYAQIQIFGNNPNPNRQRIFIELGMLELVNQLLESLHAQDKLKKSLKRRQGQIEKVQQIYKLGYQILQNVAKNNKQAKAYVSWNLVDYCKHLMNPQNSVAFKSLSEILNDNIQAIDKQGDSSLIVKSLLQTLKVCTDEFFKEDIIKFLSQFCICKDRSVKHVQLIVINQFFQSPTIPDSFKFQFRYDHECVQVGSVLTPGFLFRFRTLPELYEDSNFLVEQNAKKSHWTYFLQYLNLLADVCVHRNIQGVNYVINNLPLQWLVGLLRQTVVKQRDCFEPFVRLIHHAYIDVKPYTQISRLAKVKYWSNSNQENIPRSKCPITKGLKDVMDMIMDYVQRFQFFDPKINNQLRNVFAFLNLLKCTLNLGFWQSIEQLQRMVPCMLRILRFDKLYVLGKQEQLNQNEKLALLVKNKSSLSMNKRQNQQLVSCKILAAQILDIILDMENNIRVSLTTKLFKDIIQMNIDFSQFKLDKSSDDKDAYLLNHKIWITLLEEMLKNRNIFDCVDNKQLNYTLILFQIAIYKNQALLKHSINILSRIYGQRRQVLRTFGNIILVSRGDFYRLSQIGTLIRSRILTLANFNILTAKLSNQHTHYQHPIWQQGQTVQSCGIIQLLGFLSLSMKINCLKLEQILKHYSYENLYPFNSQNQMKQEEEVQSLYCILSQKDLNNPLYQALIMSQDHHLILVDFITITTMTDKLQDLPARALHAAYNFLTVLIWNNKQNKKQLKKYLGLFQKHIRLNVGCIQFFRQMYCNNKSLLAAQSDIQKLVDLVLQTANSLDMKSFYKSKLMDFLRVLTLFNDKGHRKNQNIVMQVISRYQVSENNKTVLTFNVSHFHVDHEQYKQWIKHYQKSYQNSKFQFNLDLCPELTYISTFFQVFCSLIQNKNIINIGKCTNMHPYIQLIKLIDEASNCMPLTRYLRSYLNKLYYSNSQYDTSLFDLFIEHQLKHICHQLKQIVILIQNFRFYNKIKINNPVRYTYLGSFIYCVLEEIFFTLNYMLSNPRFTQFLGVVLGQNQTKEDNKIHTYLISISQYCGYLCKRMQNRFINRFLGRIMQNLKLIILNFMAAECVNDYNKASRDQINNNMKQNLDFQQVPFKPKYIYYRNKSFFQNLVDVIALKKSQNKRDRIIQQQIRRSQRKDGQSTSGFSLYKEAEKQKQKQYIIDTFFLGNIEKKIRKRVTRNVESTKIVEQPKLVEVAVSRNLITSKSRNFKIKNQPQLPPQKQNQLLNQRRQRLKKFIISSKEFQTFQNKQWIQYCQQFQQIDSLSSNSYNLVVIGSQDVIKAFVQMNELNSLVVGSDLKLTFLQLITNLVSQKNKQCYRQLIQVDSWQSKHFYQYKEEIQNVQMFLNNCGVAKLICSSIKSSQIDSSILLDSQLFTLGIAFLLGGNRTCQQQILRIMQKDIQNTICLQILNLIKKMSELCLSYLRDQQEDQQQNANNQNNQQNKQTKKKKKLVFKVADTYDFYNDKQNYMIRKFGYVSEVQEESKQTEQTVKLLARVFLFLKILCQNNNIQMKNYVRQQENQDKTIKNNSVNFIQITAFELRKILKLMNRKMATLPAPMLKFLNQVTQIPCVQNQKSLCKSTFFQDMCFLSSYFQDHVHRTQREIGQLQIPILTGIFNSAIQIALSCLQGNDDTINQQLTSKIDPSFLKELIRLNLGKVKSLQQFELLLSRQQEQKSDTRQHYMHSVLVQKILKVRFVIQNLKMCASQASALKYKAIDQQAGQLGAIMNRLYAQIRCIQIQVNQKAEYLYFPNHPVFKFLSNQTKDRVMFEVNRDTMRDKLVGLFKYKQDIFRQIQYNYDLDQYKLPVSLHSFDYFRRAANFTSLLIDIFILSAMQVSVSLNPPEVVYQLNDLTYTTFMYFLALTQLVLTFFFATFWLINRTPLAISKYEDQGIHVQDGNWIWKIISKITKSKGFVAVISLFYYQDEFKSILFFITASILGTFYRVQFFAFHLFDVVGRIDILQNVFQAITTNFKQLGVVSLLGVSFICVFSVFSLQSYVKSIYPSRNPKNHCISVPSCIIHLYISQQVNSELHQFQIFRFLFDLLYVIFMEMLFGNIISGIMIDTFASLRDQRKTIQMDKKNCCFICGTSRTDLEKDLVPLQSHIHDNKHFLWDYVFYLYCLNKKFQCKQTLTGLQYQIFEKLDKQDISWIPIKKDEQQDVPSQVEEIIRNINIKACRTDSTINSLHSELSFMIKSDVKGGQ